jgi:hypothetical protein
MRRVMLDRMRRAREMLSSAPARVSLLCKRVSRCWCRLFRMLTPSSCRHRQGCHATKKQSALTSSKLIHYVHDVVLLVMRDEG